MAVEFHSVPVVEVVRETEDSVAVTIAVPEALRNQFTHRPGQHLVVRAHIDGQDVRRSYSICSAPGELIRVGIKRIPGGAFSTFALTQLAAGDLIDVMGPIGEFTASPNAAEARHHVMIAAGSGITPILSMVSALLRDEPRSHITLLYGNRTTQTIMFHEELEALKNRYPDRLQIIHVLSREPHQVPLFEGRIDAAKIGALGSGLLDVPAIAGWYLCGPVEMVEELRGALESLGVASERVHYELFFDERIDTIADVVDTQGHVEVQVTLDGRTSVVHVDPDGPSLLDYARTVRSDAPFACKGGMCATCKAVVLSGEVTMSKNYALTQGEVDAGFVLSCQAHPVGVGPIALSYDVNAGHG